MIRGRMLGLSGRRRPYVSGEIAIPFLSVEGNVDLLVDTGADTTLLAPNDAQALGIDVSRLQQGTRTRGVGGDTPTASVQAMPILDNSTFSLTLRILAPRDRSQQQALSSIPSLLGRDILSQFALFFEERTNKVLLLDPQEADALNLS